MKSAVLAALAALAIWAPSSYAAEPRTCSEAYRACVKPDFGHCDGGCTATCRLRLEGCLKTGSFSTPRVLLQGLKRR